MSCSEEILRGHFYIRICVLKFLFTGTKFPLSRPNGSKVIKISFRGYTSPSPSKKKKKRKRKTAQRVMCLFILFRPSQRWGYINLNGNGLKYKGDLKLSFVIISVRLPLSSNVPYCASDFSFTSHFIGKSSKNKYVD